VCPDINDGAQLARTLADLASLHPAVASVAVVPVGLTRQRFELQEKRSRARRSTAGAITLPDLRPVDPARAGRILDLVGEFRRGLSRRLGEPLVHGADELYLLSGRPVPSWGYYGAFPQLENGVGLVRQLLTGFARRRRFLPREVDPPRRVRLVTGMLAAPVLRQLAVVLNHIRGLRVEVAAVTNHLFGPLVTVSGLLGGEDVLARLRGMPPVDEILLPGSCLKDDHLFLDELGIDQLATKLSARLRVVPPTAAGLLAGSLGRGAGLPNGRGDDSGKAKRPLC